MKAPPFDLVTPATVAEACEALTREGAKVLAGGQSLVPLLALRLARPTVLVDVNHLGLDAVTIADGELRLGATVRHRVLELDPTVAVASPLLAEAAAHIGFPAIRHRGTIGGSLAHADPVAELPAVLVALAGRVEVAGPDGSSREIPAASLFDGFLTTSIAADELAVEVRLPVWPSGGGSGRGTAFCEWAPRAGDFAVAGVAVAVAVDADGAIDDVRGAICGVASTPVDVSPVLADAVRGRRIGDDELRAVAAAVGVALEGGRDADRAELASLLTARAVWRAWQRALS
jgi:carbon-monoxide dehydrogenase medium subunit